MKKLTSQSTPATRIGDPWADTGVNYLWRLYGLGSLISVFSGMCIVKIGFAKMVRSGDKDGVQSRVIETLRDIERSLQIGEGIISAEILACTFGTYDETLSAEQFFHGRNKNARLAGLFRDLKAEGEKPAGGHSEFFNMPTKSALAKFANANREDCKKIGLETVNWKRENGIYGCPEPRDNPKERGYA